jgi:trans-AT polyketide synthase/acyltransferase/oxidoreductase domain-containing protein
MTVFMFPGQGAQHRGMGADLYQRFPAEVRRADAILGYSIERLCLSDPDELLARTEYTQPALFIVNALHFLHEVGEPGGQACFIGHSLGEYNALHAAGALSFEDGVRLTMARGKLMSQAPKGGMAAVIGVDVAQVRDVLAASGLDQVYVANLNGPTQTVISGSEAQLERALAMLMAELGAAAVRINVSGAFHSPLMTAASAAFGKVLSGTRFRRLRHPVIANVTAQPYRPDGLAQGLTAQLVAPVRWTETVQYLQQQGETDFQEIGPGRVLTKMTQRCLVQ